MGRPLLGRLFEFRRDPANFLLQHAHVNALVEPGDIGLIISVGAGIRVGCATYYF